MMFGLQGCSTGAAPTGTITVSKQEMDAGTINVAKSYLDSLEKLSPETRQIVATKNPHTADALKKAIAIDPATKTRVESLGIQIH